ncbi:V-set and immunoglobulin domain-containing protein 8 [Haplochromis burtoni]|uniref:V-set and immunoglobulin domain-containing protein 8 n=1 Tax=Haplochromis burtoni TaxID=8153 RepID=UPI0003BCF80B|nr:V-set and immunoglobulin domain-containing protein 8 [Haplochromis burtoni]
MKDGDVSLILKDVMIDDTGTYECHVFVAETHSWQLSISDLSVVPPDQKITPAESGQDVTLTCRAPNNKIGGVKWSRADLGEEYVLLYRDGHFDPANQHKSFKNRVDLQDRQIKDGDVSLILKDVTTDDDGKYECHVFVAETDSRKPISIIYLSVFPPGQTEEEDGSVRLIVRLSVCAVVFVVAVYGFLIYTRKPCDSKTDINQEGEPLYSFREGDLKVE